MCDDTHDFDVPAERLLEWALESIYSAMFEAPGSIRSMNAIASAHFLVKRAAVQVAERSGSRAPSTDNSTR